MVDSVVPGAVSDNTAADGMILLGITPIPLTLSINRDSNRSEKHRAAASAI
jgi:hypothetical protein